MVVFGGVLGWFPGWKGRGSEKWQVDNFIGHFCPSPVPKKNIRRSGSRGGAGRQSDPFPDKKHRRDGGGILPYWKFLVILHRQTDRVENVDKRVLAMLDTQSEFAEPTPV